MQQHGVPVSAVELNARAAERVARERGVPVHAGTLFDLPEPAVPYGAITLWDVLEHVGDPAALVRRAHSLLAPSGWFFLETPDESSLLDRAVMATAALGIRAFADGFYGMHHLVLFRPATARRLLEEAGFELREMVGAETTVERSFRSSSLKDKTMRAGLGALFVTARLLGRRNKLLIAAQKRPV